jgi:hypothetical protein
MAATSPSTRLPGPPPSLPPGCRAATGPRGAHQVSGRASHRLLRLSAAAEPDRSASLIADQHLVSLPDRDPSPFLPQALLFHWSRFSPRPDHGSSLWQVCVAAPCLRHHAPASRSTGPPPRHWAAPARASQPGRFSLELDRAGQATSALGQQAIRPPRPGTVALGQNPGPAPMLFSFSC